VLLEGREQTVNYVPSPFRYSLTLSDPNVIGMRRLAQMIAGAALVKVEENKDSTAASIAAAVNAALDDLDN